MSPFCAHTGPFESGHLVCTSPLGHRHGHTYDTGDVPDGRHDDTTENQ